LAEVWACLDSNQGSSDYEIDQAEAAMTSDEALAGEISYLCNG
jgi:hypothetical protein